MADISITKYKTKVTKPTASPSNPGYPTSDPIDPVNPPASGAGGGGVNTFIQLTDTPALYTGQGAKAVSVKSDETGLEFIDFPTVTGGDEPAVKTTASADQTLPSGVLTILDYDSTLTNNATLIYSVGTDGRITVSDNGVFDITAGVVIEADALTALESAFLGIFRNGNLVAISSINTTIAAGSSSGLSCSTQIALLSGDIIDCRALVTSVGGVAPGLARRLGTLLGANATQVNSLAIVKCISNGQSFLQLSDTPATYTGQAGLFPKVNSGETGLEFASAIGGTIASGQVAFGTGVNTVGGGNITWNNASNILEFIGASTIRTSTGDLDVSTNAGNGNVNFNLNGTGKLNIKTYLDIFASATSLGVIGFNRNVITGALYSSNFAYQITNSASTGNLQLAVYNTSGTNVALHNFTGSGQFGINTSPTNTLDVNGTARIRSVANGTGNFATYSATGVLQQRTASETLADIGGIGGSIALNQIAFGTGANTIGGDSGVTYLSSAGILSLNNKPNGYLLFDQRKTSFVSGITGSAIYQSGSGGIYPFDNIGNIIIQSRSSTNRDIVFVVGSTPNVIGVFNVNGFGISTNSPTNTLDVNGTARIRSVANGTGNFATYSATGVLQQRTASEVVSDIGAVTGSGISGRVTYWNGTNTVNSDSDFLWNDSLNRLTIGSSSNAVVGTPNIFLGRDNNSETSIQISNSTSGTSGSVTVRLSGAGARNTTFGEYSSLHSLTELQNKFVIDINNINPHSFAIFINNSSSVFQIYGGGRSSTDKNLTLFSNGNLLLQRGGTHTNNGFKLDVNGTVRVQGNQTLTDGSNFIFGTTTGTKIGTATTQKLAFWNATPIVQPTTAVTGATLVGGGGTTITDTDTFDGYTLAQIVKALRNIGLLA